MAATAAVQSGRGPHDHDYFCPAYNDVYTDLFAARIAASRSCSLAERYFSHGRSLINRNGLALDQYRGDLSQLMLDTSALKSCAPGGGLLAPSPVTVPPQPVTVPPQPVTHDGP